MPGAGTRKYPREYGDYLAAAATRSVIPIQGCPSAPFWAALRRPMIRSMSSYAGKRRLEAPVTDGFILLGFLAIIFAVAVIRGRRRMGVGSTSRVFVMAAFGFAIAVLVLWATQRK